MTKATAKALLYRVEGQLQSIFMYAEHTGDDQQLAMIEVAYCETLLEISYRNGRTDWALLHRLVSTIETAHERTKAKYQ